MVVTAGYFCPQCRRVIPVHQWKNHWKRHENPTILWPKDRKPERLFDHVR